MTTLPNCTIEHFNSLLPYNYIDSVEGFFTGHCGSFIKNFFGEVGPWIHEGFSMEPNTSI